MVLSSLYSVRVLASSSVISKSSPDPIMFFFSAMRCFNSDGLHPAPMIGILEYSVAFLDLKWMAITEGKALAEGARADHWLSGCCVVAPAFVCGCVVV